MSLIALLQEQQEVAGQTLWGAGWVSPLPALFVFLECTAGMKSLWQVEFQPAALLHASILLFQQPTAEPGLKCPRCQGLGLSDGTGNGL